MIGDLIRDAHMVAWRNLLKIKRVPDLLVFTTLQPIMFILLFAYVFGGAIAGVANSDQYREFLMAGIFAQTVCFGATSTGVGIAEDRQKGMMDRFRSLPMHPGAVLAGRTFSDVVNNAIVLVVMTLTGLAVGWRIHTGFVAAVLGFGVLLFFAYALSWVMAYAGLVAKSAEVFNQASFMFIFPLTFIANTFVPLTALPTPLRIFAEWNPVSAVTQATRNLFGNLPPEQFPGVGESWPMQHPALYTVLWGVLILAVFIPLSSRRFARSTNA